MSDVQQNTLTMIVGAKGTGKTSYLDNSNNPAVLPPGILQQWLEKRRGRADERALIIDTTDHPFYRHYETILPEQLPAWKKGVKRIIVNDTIFKKRLLPIMDKHLWNCLVVFEDSTKYVKNDEKISDELANFLVDSKQKNINHVFMYHSIGMANIDICRLTDILVIFKSMDPPQGAKFGSLNEVKLKYQEVMADPDPHAKRIVVLN